MASKSSDGDRNSQLNVARTLLSNYLTIAQKFDRLLNANIVNFYVENQWNLLPNTWTVTFTDLVEPDELSYLFNAPPVDDDRRPINNRVAWPLSLLCLRTIVQQIISDRSAVEDRHQSAVEPKVANFLNKKVKSKKRHEVMELSAHVSEYARLCDVKNIVDFGSGLGHLSRFIAVNGGGLRVCCLEQNGQLAQCARDLDQKLNSSLKWFNPDIASKIIQSKHLEFRLETDTSVETFLNLIKTVFVDDGVRFGIVGLHACGDLTVDVMRLFLQAKRQAVFLNIFGCCYHKLSDSGCPLSRHWKEHFTDYRLSYNAREIACHAQEIFSKRLINKDYFYLKIHAFRATAERILFAAKMPLKHSKNVNYHDGLSFSEYIRLAGLGEENNIHATDNELEQIAEDLRQWRQIVIFYSLRIFLAPLIEHIIHIDRIVYLLENGCSSAEIVTVFDPHKSPRNQMLFVYR